MAEKAVHPVNKTIERVMKSITPKAEPAPKSNRLLYTIRLEEQHIEALKVAGEKLGVNHAEVARRAIYALLAKQTAEPKPAPVKKAPVKKVVAK